MGRRSAPLAFFVVLGATPLAAAEGTLEEARRAYDAGAKAYDAHDYKGALALFIRADELAPNPTALELALASAVLADDPVGAVELADRTKDRAATARITELRQTIHGKLERRVARVSARCEGHNDCAVVYGDRKAAAGAELVVPTGSLSVTVLADGKSVEHRVELGEGQRLVIDVRGDAGRDKEAAVAAKPIVTPPPIARTASSGGLSPAWFIAGSAVTGILLGASILSSVETSGRHDDYLNQPTAGGRDAGKGSQLRTNLLWLATGVFGVATVTTGAFFVRWKPESTNGGSALSVGYGARF